MKTFNQFLEESYICEAPRSARRRRPGGPTPEEVQAQIDAREAEKAARAAQRKPSDAAGQTQRGGALATTPKPGALATTPKPGALVKRSEGSSSVIKPQKNLEVSDVTNPRRAAGDLKLRRAAAGTGPSGRTIITPPSTPVNQAEKSAFKQAEKTAGKGVLKGTLKGLSRLVGPAAAALDVADERSKGSGWARSLAKGATVAAGSALGGALGARVAGPIGAFGGGVGGGMAASRAFDVAAGANAKERAAMRLANRQRQAGSSLKGIGGKTSFSQTKPGGPAFMSTGSGAQRKTVQLAKTGVVNRGNQSVAGHLAFKGGQAVYKAGPSAQSLAQTSSNPFERIGRTLNPNAYKAHDVKMAAQNLAKARQNDAARNVKLGVKK